MRGFFKNMVRRRKKNCGESIQFGANPKDCAPYECDDVIEATAEEVAQAIERVSDIIVKEAKNCNLTVDGVLGSMLHLFGKWDEGQITLSRDMAILYSNVSPYDLKKLIEKKMKVKK